MNTKVKEEPVTEGVNTIEKVKLIKEQNSGEKDSIVKMEIYNLVKDETTSLDTENHYLDGEDESKNTDFFCDKDEKNYSGIKDNYMESQTDDIENKDINVDEYQLEEFENEDKFNMKKEIKHTVEVKPPIIHFSDVHMEDTKKEEEEAVEEGPKECDVTDGDTDEDY